jgi:hypothetical protein
MSNVGIKPFMLQVTQHKIFLHDLPPLAAHRTSGLQIEQLFFASRNSPLLQNIFPGAGGEN